MLWFRLFANYRKHTLYVIYLYFKCKNSGISQILFGNTCLTVFIHTYLHIYVCVFNFVVLMLLLLFSMSRTLQIPKLLPIFGCLVCFKVTFRHLLFLRYNELIFPSPRLTPKVEISL
jgi:hypothetical protein